MSVFHHERASLVSTRRDNILRAVRFQGPDYVPVHFSINAACWHHYPPAALWELMESHALLFPGLKRPADGTLRKPAVWATAGKPATDAWGCVWETSDDGITGVVTKHPLQRWEDFPLLPNPDPRTTGHWGPRDWAKTAQNLSAGKARGDVATGGLTHGHTFLTLCNIRGYEALLCDMAEDEPRLWPLIERVEAFNLGEVQGWLGAGAEWMSYPEDLGMQVGPMLSPACLRKYVKPSYERLMAPARKAGCIIHMHSDGDIKLLVDDLVDAGVDVVNLQDLVNGLDWIRERLAGRVCIDLDVDRQKVTAFGTPKEIDTLIRKEVSMLGSRKGGLMMTFGLYPGTPLKNVKALMDAFERYMTYHA